MACATAASDRLSERGDQPSWWNLRKGVCYLGLHMKTRARRNVQRTGDSVAHFDPPTLKQRRGKWKV